jgi:hypothetical protein
MKPSRSTNKSLATSAPRKPPGQEPVERPAKPLPPKIVGELPVPSATFFL